jgi:hypothetical protein
MSITFSDAYTAAVSSPNDNTDWLLVIDPEGTPIRLSSADRTISDELYHGLVAEDGWGAVDENIDLKEMKLKQGDMSVKVIDSWHNATDKLSAELYNADGPHYLNKLIYIYGWSPGLTLAECPKLYEGYLREAPLDGKYINLAIEVRKQWDLIEAPNVTTEAGVTVPLIMGDYSMPTSDPTAPSLCDNDVTSVWKAPVVEVSGGNVRALLHEDADDQANDWIAGIFQPSFNLFYPLATTATGTGFDDDEHFYESIDGVDHFVGHADYVLRHTFYSDQLREHDDNEFDDFENIECCSTAYASDTITAWGTSGTRSASAWGNIVKPKYWWKEQASKPGYRLKVEIEEVIGSIDAAGTWELRIEVKINGATLFDLKPADGGGNWIDPYGESFPYTETFAFNTDGSVEGEDTDTIEIACSIHDVASDVGDTLQYKFKLNSYRCEYHVQSVETTDTEEEFKNANDVKELYFGAPGISATYTGGSGEPTKAHEMLRELLNRYAGINYADSAITGWAALDTARGDGYWECRLREYKPKDMQHYVDELQKHGAFIWQPQIAAARVIYVKDSYSAGDVDIAIDGKKDLDGIKVKTIPMSGVTSKTIWKYKQHPATGDFMVEYPKLNSIRSNWGYATDENVATTELRYFVGTPSEIATIYDNIYGSPKIIVDATLVTPSLQKMQVGDIVTFSNMPFAPYGYAWSGSYYMITKTLRSKGSIKFTAREVG